MGWAVARGSLKAVELLVASRADVRSKDGFGIGAAAASAYRGDDVILREVISAGGSVNALDRLQQSPLHFACLNGHLTVVQALLEKTADLAHRSRYGGDALYCATEA